VTLPILLRVLIESKAYLRGLKQGLNNMTLLNHKLMLPNGSILRNRLAKSALSENLGSKKHAPTETLIGLYKRWSASESGLIITGNIMIDSKALGEARNVVIEDRSNLELLKKWAETMKGSDTHIWPQINHPGRQAMENINKELMAPSAVPMMSLGRKKASKKIPRALREEEIIDIINRYSEAALICKEAGFTGTQIHGAHGYLVSQFLSPKTNIRTDKWGGSLEDRARFVLEIYRSMRKKLGADYPISIKLNSADFQKGGFTEEESMEVIKLLSKEGIDLIEISGGNYEAPAMMGSSKRKSTLEREAFFMDYIEKARKITDTPLMLTGGFRTKKGMESALESNSLDVIGLGRPFAIYPALPADLFNNRASDFKVDFRRTNVKAIDAALNLIWYEAQLERLGKGLEPDKNLNGWKVFANYAWILMQKGFSKN